MIKIRQSFNTSGSSIFEIEKESILISGADVELKHNGKLITVVEESPGHYRPDSPHVVNSGDYFNIVVAKDDKRASAFAQVPDYSVEEINILPGEEIELSAWSLPETGPIWEGTLPVNFHLSFMPAFTAIKAISEMEKEAYGDFKSQPGGTRSLEFHTYLADDYSNQTTLSADHSVSIFYPRTEGEGKPGGKKSVAIHYSIIIPEPIYETWHSTQSDDMVPVTITNVEGGVGLFIGAIRVEKEMNVEVNLK